MPKCTRKGCGKDYEENDNTDTSCHHHSGAPVFHEGLKSWSCCSDVNKPVLDFESFMAIPVCAVGSHSQDKPRPEPPQSSGAISSGSSLKLENSAGGQETYSTAGPGRSGALSTPTIAHAVTPTPPVAYVEEEDDTSVSVPVDTPCQRRGCDAKFTSEEESRLGNGEGTVCTYHPAPPLFREGSKGYLCCKKRVLEFDEFMKIKGCKTGKHLFAPKKTENGSQELITCRIDHYQTPSEVHVSVFAKQTDKTASTVRFDDSKVYLDLLMPVSKRFQRTLDLYGPIDPLASKYTFFGTKVELVLAKADTRSWILLEKSQHATASLNLTFGVGGRTGTIGAKELVLDSDNKSKAG